MLYVFTFLGEFGYELLNWQGVVRRFAASLPEGDRIVCCSRAGVAPLYESAAAYFDIGDVPGFRETRAVRYWTARSRGRLTSLRDVASDSALKRRLRRIIRRWLDEAGVSRPDEPVRFVFSSDGVRLRGCNFGPVGYRYTPFGVLVSDVCAFGKWLLPRRTTERLARAKRRLLDRAPVVDYRGDGDIYSRLDLGNNVYRKLEPDQASRAAVEAKLGWRLDEPFLLVQGRRRDKAQASSDRLPENAVNRALRRLAGRTRLLLLGFSTGRWLDSYSVFAAGGAGARYECRSFPEQACLVHFARHCLFLTEGDLGSHTYVPPLMGRDVSIMAPRSVFALESSPVEFWNRHVFRFGGQMIPEPVETLPEDEPGFLARILQRYAASRA
jgi:hypothetical protein